MWKQTGTSSWFSSLSAAESAGEVMHGNMAEHESIMGSCKQCTKSQYQMEELAIAHSLAGMIKSFQKSGHFGAIQTNAAAAFCPGVHVWVCTYIKWLLPDKRFVGVSSAVSAGFSSGFCLRAALNFSWMWWL